MLLLLMLGMLEVLVVLKGLVVFLRGKFEGVKSTNFLGENYKTQKESFWPKNISKNP